MAIWRGSAAHLCESGPTWIPDGNRPFLSDPISNDTTSTYDYSGLRNNTHLSIGISRLKICSCHVKLFLIIWQKIIQRISLKKNQEHSVKNFPWIRKDANPTLYLGSIFSAKRHIRANILLLKNPSMSVIKNTRVHHNLKKGSEVSHSHQSLQSGHSFFPVIVFLWLKKPWFHKLQLGFF